MKSTHVRMAVMLAVAIVGIGRGIQETKLHAVSVSEPVVAESHGPCALACWMGLGGSCPSDYHLAITTSVESARNAEWGTGPHNDYMCYAGSCDEMHGLDCTPLEELESLRASMASEDIVRTALLLRNTDRDIVLNVGRSAIQVLDCQSAVVAHLPISTRDLHRLQALLEN